MNCVQKDGFDRRLVALVALFVYSVSSFNIGRVSDVKGDRSLTCMDCSDGTCKNNSTCLFDNAYPSYCYTFWSQLNESVIVIAAGCYTLDDDCREDCTADAPISSPRPGIRRSDKYSKNHNDSHQYLEYFCCCSRDMCNSKFVVGNGAKKRDKTLVLDEVKEQDGEWYNRRAYLLSLLIILPALCISLGSLWLFVRILRRRRKYKNRLLLPYAKGDQNAKRRSTFVEKMPLVRFDSVISRGRQSTVWRATELATGQFVAVKTFQSRDVRSWSDECAIYLQHKIKHPNVLLCMGAGISKNFHKARVGDVVPNLSCRRLPTHNYYYTHLMLEYHPRGSLDSHLEKMCVSLSEAVDIITDVCRGLSYLHSVSADGQQHQQFKPCIAHRDLKGTNILIKQDGTCCIADFGLAIALVSEHHTERISQAGTIRYMAPEILDGCISYRYDSLAMMDVYSLGLVMWEVMSRCSDFPGHNQAFLRAYEMELGDHPTKEMMHILVVKNKVRPAVMNGWSDFEMASFFSELMSECWEQEPDARITSNCAYQRIQSARQAGNILSSLVV